jgi:hypothetical protein
MSQLLFIDKIPNAERSKFVEYLTKISAILSVNPNWLMYIFDSESGVKPNAVNPNGGATGLIQFMPSTAIALGTTTERLKQMTATEQLYFVMKYYLRYANKISSIEQLYLINFYPYALNQTNNYIIGSEKGMDYARKIVQVNPRTQPDKTKNTVTKQEYLQGVKNRIASKLTESQLKLIYAANTQKNSYVAAFLLISIATLIILK